MSSSICFIPRIYHDWENMEINKFNFLLTKETQFFYTCNFAASSCRTCDNRTPKRPVIKDNACEFRTSELNMVCVCARARAIARHSWSGLNYGILLGKVHNFTSLRGRYGIETCCGYVFFVFSIR